jgi:hypothetical protein
MGSLLNNENRFYDELPPRGLSEERRGNEGLDSYSSIRRGAPFGAAEVIAFLTMGVSTFIIISDKMIFIRNPLKKGGSRGCTPWAAWERVGVTLQKADKRQ